MAESKYKFLNSVSGFVSEILSKIGKTGQNWEKACQIKFNNFIKLSHMRRSGNPRFLIRNQQVAGSNPIAGLFIFRGLQSMLWHWWELGSCIFPIWQFFFGNLNGAVQFRQQKLSGRKIENIASSGKVSATRRQCRSCFSLQPEPNSAISFMANSTMIYFPYSARWLCNTLSRISTPICQ